MRNGYFLGALYAAAVGACAAPRQQSDDPVLRQPTHEDRLDGPAVRISSVSTDSLGLHLADSGYVLVIEFSPQGHPRVIYPGSDDHWSVLPPGPTTLHVPVTVVAQSLKLEEPTPQCVVGPEELQSWSVKNGLRPTISRTACGPIPSPRAHSSVDDPIWDLVASHYEFTSPNTSYLVAWLFDPRMPPRGLGGLSATPELDPVVLARRTGRELTRQSTQDQIWQAAIWIAR